MKKHIPNLITCFNLFSGCIAITFAFKGQLDIAAYLILLSAVFDFLDGMFARLLHAYSEIGKQLDSLADMVSFGFAPGVFVYMLLSSSLAMSGQSEYWAYAAFIIPVFSALRLANFNIDERQSVNFIGLPTPANTLFFIALPFALNSYAPFLLNPWVLIMLSLVMSWLLVAELPLFSMKMKNFALSENIHRYILILISAILIIFLKFAAVPVVIILYILLSIIFKKKFAEQL